MNDNAPQVNMNPGEPTPAPMMGGEGQPERKYGPLIGIIIIITLLIVGGFYLWGAQIADRVNKESTQETSEDPMTETLRLQGSSDEVNAIESDLEATSIESIDAELGDIESELEGELQVQ